MSDARGSRAQAVRGALRFHLGRDVGIDSLPPQRLNEIAFVGRSNAGKSSLINALTGRKSRGAGLADARRAPARSISSIWADRLMLVDLPGYGYAKALQDGWRWNGRT